MGGKLTECKVFKDPIHNYIHVEDALIWDLINTFEFQRLRRIRQLGTSYLTFHGAEHSRFSHSLGVYEVTRKIIFEFEKNKYPDWPTEEKQLALCAALLHDIGHGPFSHSIEEVFDTNHEDWTCKIILGETETATILKRVSPDFPQKVVSVIKKTYHLPIVVHLVSSPLDADRMDYLLRDAYFTGVNYGTIDLDRILRTIRPYEGKIVVKQSGMHAVEHYLMSRYQMYWQIYFHPVTRSSEIILRQIFKRAKQLYCSGFRFKFMLPCLSKLLQNCLTVSDYLQIDESSIQTAFVQWKQEEDFILQNLCVRFINRCLYKYIEVDHLDQDVLQEIHGLFSKLGLDPQYDWEVDVSTHFSYNYMYEEETRAHQIFVLDDFQKIHKLTDISKISRSISVLKPRKCYLYYPYEKLIQNLDQFSPAMLALFQIKAEEVDLQLQKRGIQI